MGAAVNAPQEADRPIGANEQDRRRGDGFCCRLGTSVGCAA
jgi:hypothetical protein